MRKILAVMLLACFLSAPFSASTIGTDIRDSADATPVFLDVYTSPRHPLGADWTTGEGGDVITVYANVTNVLDNNVWVTWFFTNRMQCIPNMYDVMTHVSGSLYKFVLPGDVFHGWDVFEASASTAQHIGIRLEADPTEGIGDYVAYPAPDEYHYIYPAYRPTQINTTYTVSKTTMYTGQSIWVNGTSHYWNSTSYPNDFNKLLPCDECPVAVSVGPGTFTGKTDIWGNYSVQAVAPFVPGNYDVNVTVSNATANRNVPCVSSEVQISVSDSGSLVAHPPIRIDSNAEFDGAHGVTGGNGTQSSPWVIENWDINGTGYGYCIYIGNTTDYFVVRNCYLHEANGMDLEPFYRDYGIMVFNTHNGRIFDNVVSKNDMYGMRVYQSSSNIIVTNNSVSFSNFDGIAIQYSSNNIVTDNGLQSNSQGIALTHSDGNAIDNNRIFNSSLAGIRLYSSDNNSIVNNNASLNGVMGISLDSCANNSITENVVASSNDYGMQLVSSDNNEIFHNALMLNSDQAYDDGVNSWDDGYPSGGNYWSDYNGTDANGDGIGDTPYIIDWGSQDNYPLMEPWTGYLPHPEPAAEDLIIALQQDMINMNLFDPDTNDVWKTDQLQFNFEGLMAYNPDYELHPMLAAENPAGPNGADATISPDGMNITVNLRQGVTFHDGHIMDSQDIVFSYQTLAWGLYRAQILTPLEWTSAQWARYDGGATRIGVEAVDVDTVVFHLAQPYAMFWYSTLTVPLIPYHIWNGLTLDTYDGEKTLDYSYGSEVTQTDATIGTGPMMLDSWVKDQGCVLMRYENYWNKNGTMNWQGREYPCYPWYVKSISFNIYPQQEAALSALRRGEVHQVPWSITPGMMNSLSTSLGIGFEMNKYQGFFFLSYNFRKGAMQDVNFRRAVAYCVDKQYIVDGLMEGYGIQGSIPISMTNQLYVNDTVPAWVAGGNLAAAEALLDANGYTDINGDGWRELPDGSPLKYSILTPPKDYDPIRADSGIMIEKNLRSIGLNIAAVPTSFDTIVSAAYVSLDFDMYILGWTVGSFPELYLRDFFHGDSDVALNPVGSNAAGYHNATVDAMIEEMEVTMDTEDRVQLIKDICGATMMDMPYDVLYYRTNPEAYRRDTWQGWISFSGTIYNRYSINNIVPFDMSPSYGALEFGLYAPDSIPADSNSTCYALVTDNALPAVNAHVVVRTNFGVTLDGYTNAFGCAEFDFSVPLAEGKLIFSANATYGAKTGGSLKESTAIISEKPIAQLSLSTLDGVVPPSGITTVTARVTDNLGTGIGGIDVTVDTKLMFGSVDFSVRATNQAGYANFTYTAPLASMLANTNRYEQFKAFIDVPNTMVKEVQSASLIIGVEDDVADWYSIDIIDVSDYVITGNASGTLPMATDITVRVLNSDGLPVIGERVDVNIDSAIAFPDATLKFTNVSGEAVFTLSAADIGNATMSTIVSVLSLFRAYSTGDSILLCNANEGNYTTAYAAEIDFDYIMGHHSTATVTATVWDQTGSPVAGVPCQFFIPPIAEGIPGVFQDGDSWGWEEYGGTMDLGWYAGYIGSWYGPRYTTTDANGQLVATISTPSFIADSAIPLEFGIGGYGITEDFNYSANNFWMEDYGASNWAPPMTDNADGNFFWRAADFTLRDSAILLRAPVATLTSVVLDSSCFFSNDPDGTISMEFQNGTGVLVYSNVQISSGVAKPTWLSDGYTNSFGSYSHAYSAPISEFDSGLGFTAMVTETGYSHFPFTFYFPYIAQPSEYSDLTVAVEPSAYVVQNYSHVDFHVNVMGADGNPAPFASIYVGSSTYYADEYGQATISLEMIGSGIVNASFNAYFGGRAGNMTAGVIVVANTSWEEMVLNQNQNLWYPTIQMAIDFATPGDSLWARNGTYYENIHIDKPLNLMGEDRDITIIDGSGYGTVVYVQSSNVNISGFTIQESGTSIWDYSGIELPMNIANCHIRDNKMISNLNGIFLYSSNNNTVNDNILLNNSYGIYVVYYSNNNIIFNNTISNNHQDGIYLSQYSGFNDISRNVVSDNACGIRTEMYVNNNSVSNNLIRYNNYGILFFGERCNSNTITQNNIINNHMYGIYIYTLNDPHKLNIISYNNILSNGNNGIYMDWGTQYNVIHHNNLADHWLMNAVDYSGMNFWDDGYPSGGNYWGDYTGNDFYSGPYQDIPGFDGFGDTPYTNMRVTEPAQDGYPLMRSIPGCGVQPINDTQPPQHVNESPAPGTVICNPAPTISAWLYDNSWVNESTIKLYVNGFSVKTQKALKSDGQNVYFNVSYTHASGFQDGQVVTCRITARDVCGNYMEYSWQFTVDLAAPHVVSVSPSDASIDVSRETAITVLFSEPMDQSSAEAAFCVSPQASGYFTWNGNEMTFHTNSRLAANTTYSLSVIWCATDVAGNYLSPEYYWSFTTVPSSITIVHSPVPFSELGQPVTIECQIEVLWGYSATSCTLYFMGIGQSAYTSVAMSLVSGNLQWGTWSGTIPAQNSIGTVRYYIQAWDDSSESATHPLTDPETNPHQISVVDTTAPLLSGEQPAAGTTSSEVVGLVSVNITDLSAINTNSIWLIINGFSVDYSLALIPGGYMVTYVQEEPFDAGSYQCRIMAEDVWGNALDWSWSFSVISIASPELVMDKWAPPTANPGYSILYSLNVTNIGNDWAYDVMVTETYPPGVTFLAAAPFPTVGDFMWIISNIAPGASISIIVCVNVDTTTAPGSMLTNLATVYYTDILGSPFQSQDTAITLIVAPLMVIDKAGPLEAETGDTISYTVTYMNVGDDVAYNVVVYDILPAGVVYVGAVPSPGAVMGQTLTWVIEAVPPAAMVSIVITVAVTAASGTLVNEATVDYMDRNGRIYPTEIDYWYTTVLNAPPSHSNEFPAIGGFTADITPEISVHVTDATGVNASSVRLYINGFSVSYDLTPVPGGYNVSYWHESGFSVGQNVTCRIYAKDVSGNTLDFTWHFTVTGMSFNILIQAGWNLISLPLVQGNTNVETVLSSIAGKWDAVKYYDTQDAADPWKTYRIGGTANDLFDIDHTMGLWLHALQNATLTVYGSVPTTTDINLYAGWNLVGYPTLNQTWTAEQALFGTGYEQLEGYVPASPYIAQLNGSYVMMPGEGYWVYVPADAVWNVAFSAPTNWDDRNAEIPSSDTKGSGSIAPQDTSQESGQAGPETDIDLNSDRTGAASSGSASLFALLLVVAIGMSRRRRKNINVPWKWRIVG